MCRVLVDNVDLVEGRARVDEEVLHERGLADPGRADEESPVGPGKVADVAPPAFIPDLFGNFVLLWGIFSTSQYLFGLNYIIAERID